MRVRYYPKGVNYHQAPAVNLLVSGRLTKGKNRLLYRINAAQAQTIARHFCGIRGCRCAKGATELLNSGGTEYGIPIEYCLRPLPQKLARRRKAASLTRDTPVMPKKKLHSAAPVPDPASV